MLNHSRFLTFKVQTKSNCVLRSIKISLFSALISFSITTFAASNNGLVYHGRIADTNNVPVNSGTVAFTLEIYGSSTKYWDGSALQTGNTRCLLFREVHSKNMANSMGAFELVVGQGTSQVWGTGAAAADQRISKLFVNNPVDTGNYIKAVSCTPLGHSLYFPSGPDATAPEWVDREMQVTILVNGQTVALAPMQIKAQPFALQAQQIGGFSPNNLFRIDGTSNSKFSVLQHDFLANSISYDGTRMRILGLPALPVSDTEAASKAYVDSVVGGGSVINSVSGVAPIQSSGGSNPAISISQASATIPGYLSAADWTTFNNKLGTGSVFAGDISGPYNNITLNDNVVTTAKISDGAVTYAKMQNMTGPGLLGRGAAGAGPVGEISVGSGLSLSVGGVLTATNAGTVTTVTGVAPVQSTGGATPAISMSQASGTIPGYLSAADWTTFNNKVSSLTGAGLVSIGGTTTAPSIQISLDSQKIAGRYSAGSGLAEEISIGSGLNLSAGGVLSVTGSGFVTNVLGSGPVSSSGGATPTISISTASTSVSGALTSTDWNIFNNKLSSITGLGLLTVGGTATAPTMTISVPTGNLVGRYTAATGAAESISIGSGLNLSAGGVLTATNAGTVTSVTGAGPISSTGGANPSISISTASGTVTGALSSADWTTFNNKLGTASVFAGDISGTYNSNFIVADAVTTAKISDANVTAAKLGASTSQVLFGRYDAGAGPGQEISIGSGLNLSAGGVLTMSGAGIVASVNGSGPISVTAGSNPTVSISMANASTHGYISSGDWTIFNNKVSSLTGAGLISIGNAGTTPSVQISMDSQKIAGRYSAGSGLAEEISIGSGLNLSAGGVLTATNSSGSISNAGGYVQGGNAFGALGTIGTNDNFGLQIKTNNSPAISISANGKVAIGATSTSAQLQVGPSNGTNITFLPDSDTILNGNWNGDSRVLISQNSANSFGAAIGVTDVGGIRLGKSANYSYLIGDGTNLLLNPTAGAVGILTNNPSYPLDVRGTIQSQGAAVGGQIQFGEAAGTGNDYIALKAPNSIASSVTYTLPPADGVSGAVLSTNGSGVMSWQSMANSVSNAGGFLNGGNAFGGNAVLGTLDNRPLSIITNNTTAMVVSQDGSVGIGTATPSEMLHIQYPWGSAVARIEGTNNTTGQGAAVMVAGSGGSQRVLEVKQELTEAMIGTSSVGGSTPLHLGTNSSKIITMTIGGQVGIGTTSPTAGISLDVAGPILSRGAAAAGSLRLGEVGNVNHVTLKSADTLSGDFTLTLPTGAGSVNQALLTDGNGVLSWGTPATSSAAISNAGGYVQGGNAFGALATLGTLDNFGMQIVANNSPAISISSNGNVGIGDTGAEAKLTTLNGHIYMKQTTNDSSTPQLKFRKSRGPAGAVSSVDVLGAILFEGHDGSGMFTPVRIRGIVDGDVSTGVVPGGITFETRSTFGGITQRMKLTHAGDVGIGNNYAPRAKLDVDGTIVGKAAVSNGALADIDFGAGNIQYTTGNCGAMNLKNMKDGGTYTLVIKGTTSATCVFTAYSGNLTGALTPKYPPGHGATTDTKMTIYSFMVVGTDVFIAWVPGY